MSTSIFAVNTAGKSLRQLPRKSMFELGLSEPYDLEAWLASSSDGLFGRQVIWIMRQDRPSDDQRSDLVGIDKDGDLLVTELKKGELGEDAITQALAYAAEYAGKSAEDLAALFATHSEKGGTTGLVTKASSLDDALARLSAHVGAETEVNENQVLLLVAENFTAKALAICEYLNGASGEPSFFIECWRYAVFEAAPGSYCFLLEQVLPPPSVRQEIEEKREASKARKYARDPVRVAFMRALLSHLGANDQVRAWRNQGQSYECRIKSGSWMGDHDLWFSVSRDRPRLLLPIELILDGIALDHHVVAGTDNDGRRTLEFVDVDVRTAKFVPAFGDRLIKLVDALKVAVPPVETIRATNGNT